MKNIVCDVCGRNISSRDVMRAEDSNSIILKTNTKKEIYEDVCETCMKEVQALIKNMSKKKQVENLSDKAKATKKKLEDTVKKVEKNNSKIENSKKDEKHVMKVYDSELNGIIIAGIGDYTPGKYEADMSKYLIQLGNITNEFLNRELIVIWENEDLTPAICYEISKRIRDCIFSGENKFHLDSVSVFIKEKGESYEQHI